MEFIELSGSTLFKLLKEDEMSPDDLRAAGISDETIVRINQQGDIEMRCTDRWDVIGGLLGDYERRLKKMTGLTWAEEEGEKNYL